MMKLLKSIFFLFILTAFSNVSWGKDHYIFLVHGLASTPEMFGSMQEALKIDLQKNDPSVNWVIKPFKYDTGNNKKTVMDFSRDLADFIKGQLSFKGQLQDDKEFSLIMHSQGGVIGMRMMLEMYKENFRYHPQLLSRLDAYISLGTPYWGSKAAVFASRLKPIFDYLKLPLHDRFGLQELRDLEIGSDYTAEMRKELLLMENQNFVNNFRLDKRLLVISGVSESLNLLAPIMTGKYRFEDDLVVPIPMAHLDYFYFIEDPQDIREKVEVREFQKSHIIDEDDYMIINALHVSPLPENKYLRDMMYIPKSCLKGDYQRCDHPSYKSIVDHLLNRQRGPYFKRDLTSFGVDLKIIPPGNNKSLINNLNITYKSLSYGAKIGSPLELYSHVKRIDSEGNLRVFRTGDIDSKIAISTKAYFEMKLEVKGETLKIVTFPVQTSTSSYIEIYLKDN